MDFVRSTSVQMNLCQLNTFFLTFWLVCCVCAANRPKSEEKVFNWQKFICTEVTSYKIHTLEAALAQQGGSERLRISVFILLKNSVPVFYSACLPQAQWSSVGGTVRTKNSCRLLMWFDIEKLTQNFRSGV